MAGQTSTHLGRGRVAAFTLVELLVVIGIIALLISILLPSLNRARGQAREIMCRSNLRQMGLALTLYINDWKHFPGARGKAENFPNTRPIPIWPTRLRAYMKGNQGVFRCPVQTSDEFAWKVNNRTPPLATVKDSSFGYIPGESLLFEDSKFCYGYNNWGAHNVTYPCRGLGSEVWDKRCAEAKASLMRSPSTLIVITDNSLPDGNFDLIIDPTDPKEFPGTIHRGGCNVLYGDGHSDWRKQDELLLCDPANPNQIWNPSHPQGGAPALARKWNTIAPQWNLDNKP